MEATLSLVCGSERKWGEGGGGEIQEEKEKRKKGRRYMRVDVMRVGIE